MRNSLEGCRRGGAPLHTRIVSQLYGSRRNPSERNARVSPRTAVPHCSKARRHLSETVARSDGVVDAAVRRVADPGSVDAANVRAALARLTEAGAGRARVGRS